MNENCKYCKTSGTCLEMAEYNSIYCQLHRRIPRVIEKTYEELKQENEQLKEQLEANKKARKEAIEYINVTEYSDIVGLNKNGIKEFWFVKDLLKILSIDKGE